MFKIYDLYTKRFGNEEVYDYMEGTDYNDYVDYKDLLCEPNPLRVEGVIEYYGTDTRVKDKKQIVFLYGIFCNIEDNNIYKCYSLPVLKMLESFLNGKKCVLEKEETAFGSTYYVSEYKEKKRNKEDRGE